MKNYIVSKQHANKKTYLTASAITATILLSTPAILSAETVLNEINVNEKKDNYSESYKVDKSSSSKITQDLIDTPQTVQVITKKVMDEQKATTLQDALKNTPGITLLLGENGNTNSKNNISMRGFDVSSSIYKDGVRDLNGSTRDMFNTEAVEVTKGTVGADNGRSVPTGYINQVTKTATNKDQNEVTTSYGTAKNGRVTANLNKALSETSGVRLNVMKNKGDVAGRDEVEIDRTGIAASVAFGIGTDTRTSFNYERYEQDDIPDGGIPTIGLKGYYNSVFDAANINPSKVDTENFYGSSKDYEKVTTDTYTAKFEHDFNDRTALINTTRYSKSKQTMLLTAPFSVITTTTGANSNPNFNVNDPSTWTVRESAHTKWQENEILTNATNITTSFNTGSMILHNLSGGFDVTIDNQTTKTYATTGSTINQGNLYNPNPSNVITNLVLEPTGAKTFGETKTLGTYLFDSANIGEKVIITGGARLDKYNTNTDVTTIATATTPGGGVPVGTKVTDSFEKDGTLISYKIGGVYKIAENGSIYLSYATSQLPPAGENFVLSATGQNSSAMDPKDSTTTELGTKWDLFDDKLSLTTAIYKTEVKNETITESDGSVSQNGEREVKGIEVGLVGQITDRWAITAGIGKSETEVLKATNTNPSNTQQGASLRFTPEWTGTLWTTYKIIPALTIGAGARYVGKQYASTSNAAQNGTATTPIREIDSYITFDVMGSYQITKDLSAQLNIYNIADKEYVQNMNNSGQRYTPGTPRTGLISLAYKF